MRLLERIGKLAGHAHAPVTESSGRIACATCDEVLGWDEAVAMDAVKADLDDELADR